MATPTSLFPAVSTESTLLWTSLTRRSPMKKNTSLKLGNVYISDYDDHFEASRVGSESQAMLEPVVLRAIGRLVAITPKQYNLEFSSQISHVSGEYQHSITGIMRSCVTKVIDLGPISRS